MPILLKLAAAIACTGIFVLPLRAQPYPSKTVRLVIPAPPGGSTDVLGRAVAKLLSDRLKYDVIAENRPGTGGLTAVESVTKASPDGYTLLFADVTTLTISPLIYTRPAFYLEPVVRLGSVPYILASHPSIPARNLKDLVVLAKGKPGQYTYASSGIGSLSHLGTELLKTVTKTDLIHVPYKGAGQAMIDVVAGHVPLTFASAGALQTFIASGRLRPLVIAGRKRLASLNNVPTTADEGYPDVVVELWFGLAAPRNTSGSIISQLNAEAQKGLGDTSFLRQLDNAYFEPAGGSPADFQKFLRDESAKWSRVVKSTGVKAE